MTKGCRGIGFSGSGGRSTTTQAKPPIVAPSTVPFAARLRRSGSLASRLPGQRPSGSTGSTGSTGTGGHGVGGAGTGGAGAGAACGDVASFIPAWAAKAVPSKEIYVSPSGDDNLNDGSKAKPFQTTAKAFSLLAPGVRLDFGAERTEFIPIWATIVLVLALLLIWMIRGDW